MSYRRNRGLGLVLMPSITRMGTVGAPAQSTPVSDGMPAALIASLRAAFAGASRNDWGSDTDTPFKLNSFAVLLGAIKPNGSGKTPAAPVKQLLANAPTNLYPYVDRFLSGTSIAKVISDISAGLYTPATVQLIPVNLSEPSVFMTPLKTSPSLPPPSPPSPSPSPSNDQTVPPQPDSSSILPPDTTMPDTSAIQDQAQQADAVAQANAQLTTTAPTFGSRLKSVYIDVPTNKKAMALGAALAVGGATYWGTKSTGKAAGAAVAVALIAPWLLVSMGSRG